MITEVTGPTTSPPRPGVPTQVRRASYPATARQDPASKSAVSAKANDLENTSTRSAPAGWPRPAPLTFVAGDARTDAAAEHAQFGLIIALQEEFPTLAKHLERARVDIFAFTASSREIWRQIWSNNPNERLSGESGAIRTSWASFRQPVIVRLVGAGPAEHHDGRTEAVANSVRTRA